MVPSAPPIRRRNGQRAENQECLDVPRMSSVRTIIFPRLFLSFVVLILLALAYKPSIARQSRLEYQNRGNRYEGIKPKPVSGYDVELLSATVDYREPPERMPDRLRIRFYLEQDSTVYVTVRELDYKYYYWLDKVTPAKPWRAGFDNVLEWPTKDVLQQLGEMNMYDLGVVARLEKPEPSIIERVAPVIFYHSEPAGSIDGYIFTFKTNGDARLTCTFHKAGAKAAVATTVFPRQVGGRPFAVRWNSSQAAEGEYRLVLMGYFLDSNAPINQTVSFYHKALSR